MNKRLAGILCAAALAVVLLALPARAVSERTHRAYLCGYPDGTIRPDAAVTRAQLACALARLAEDELPKTTRAVFFDVPRTHWASAQIGTLSALGLLPFGENGWFLPSAPVTWRELCDMMNALTDSETGRTLFPALTGAWDAKAVFDAGQGDDAGGAAVSRAEFARAVNSLLGRKPDASDPQLRAAAWYWDNQDETAWYYAELIEAAVDHTCRVPERAECWSAIG